MAALTLKDAIAAIFNKSRETEGNHVTLCKKMHKIYEETRKKDSFLETFCEMLKRILVFGQRDKLVHCSMEFAIRFILSFPAVKDSENAESEEETNWHPFVVDVFNFLLDNHDAESQAVRFRVCQFVNRILDGMEERADISSDLYDKIADAMFERLMDRVPGVRLQAAIALERLQDPTNKNCGVMSVLLFHLEKDPNPEVRRAILKLIAPTHASLEKILVRLHDTARNVRHQALIYLSERVHIRTLKIPQRLTILRAIHSPNLDFDTQLVKEKFLRTWLEGVDHSLLKLLERLDVEESWELAIKTLHLIFTSWNSKEIISQLELLSPEKLIPTGQLTSELAVYWLACIEYFHTENQSEALEQILPEMLDFSRLLMELYARLRETTDTVLCLSLEFIFKQLLRFAPRFNTAEEVGRANLTKTLLLFLQDPNTRMNLIRPIAKAYCLLEPRFESRILRLLEVISELREPLAEVEVLEVHQSQDRDEKRTVQAAQLRVKLMAVREELGNAVSEENFDQAKILKAEIEKLENELSRPTVNVQFADVEQAREEKNDPDTLIRCLSIACELVQSERIRTPGPELLEMVNSLILPCVQQEDPNVRYVALEALACCCMFSKDLAQRHMIIFLSALSVDSEEIKSIAASAIADLLLFFGLQSFEERDEPVRLLSSQIDQTVHALLTSGSKELLVENAADGLCKLFLARRVESVEALARLIIALFNPATEKNNKLRQLLNLFFSCFASMSADTQNQIEEAFQPTMKLIRKAPVTSPVSQIDVPAVVKFFIDMTRKLLIRGTQLDVQHFPHNKLALKFLQEARKRPDSMESRTYLKALLTLELGFSERRKIREMHDQTRRLLRSVRDKTTVKCLEKFSCLLEGFLQDEEEGFADLSAANQTRSRPRARQQLLMSKTTTMLMNTIEEYEDDEPSNRPAQTVQDSPDMFHSPPPPSTNKNRGKKSIKKETTTPPPIRVAASSSSSDSRHSLVIIDESDDDFVREATPPKRVLRSAKKQK